MSEWLKLYYDVFDHPKTKRMSKILKMPTPHIVGHLASLWAFTARYAVNGDLTDLDDEEIEVGACWEGDDGTFLKAALTVGYLDSDADGKTVRIHDWDDYGGKYAGRRARNAERMRESRAKNVQRTKDAQDGTCDERVHNVQNCAGLEERRGEYKELVPEKLSAASDEDWMKRAEEVLEQTQFAAEYRDLADLMAAANKTGEVTVRRVVTSLYEPLLAAEQNGVGRDAFEYGLRAAIAKGAFNVNYVKQAAKSYAGDRGMAGPSLDSDGAERLKYYDIALSPPAWRYSDDDSLVET